MGIGKSKMVTRKILVMSIAIVAVVGMGAGFLIGNIGGTSTAKTEIIDTGALNIIGLPSLPAGMSAQNVIDNGTLESALTRLDEISDKMAAALVEEFGLRFEAPVDAVAFPSTDSSFTESDFLYAITSKAYFAQNQTISADNRARAVAIIQEIAAEYGMVENTSVYSRSTDSEDAALTEASTIMLSGWAPGEPSSYTVEISDIPADEDVPDAVAIQAVVIYLNSDGYIKDGTESAFRDAITAEYQRYLAGEIQLVSNG